MVRAKSEAQPAYRG